MIRTGQILLIHSRRGFWGRLVQWGTRSHWNHAAVMVDPYHCLSAEPGGAVLRPITYYRHEEVVSSRFDLTPEQRTTIHLWALGHIDVEYNFGDFILAGIASVTGRATPKWLRRIIATPDRMICSQLCDYAYQAAGIHLFDDARPEGAVIPADFGRLFRTHGWTDKD
jgi:uncharacterized protein YycO